jgi:hypothetical protein
LSPTDNPIRNLKNLQVGLARQRQELDALQRLNQLPPNNDLRMADSPRTLPFGLSNAVRSPGSLRLEE